jgi:hypothetical protein
VVLVAGMDALDGTLSAVVPAPARRPTTRALAAELAALALRTRANEVRTPHDGSSEERSLSSPP